MVHDRTLTTETSGAERSIMPHPDAYRTEQRQHEVAIVVADYLSHAHGLMTGWILQLPDEEVQSVLEPAWKMLDQFIPEAKSDA